MQYLRGEVLLSSVRRSAGFHPDLQVRTTLDNALNSSTGNTIRKLENWKTKASIDLDMGLGKLPHRRSQFFDATPRMLHALDTPSRPRYTIDDTRALVRVTGLRAVTVTITKPSRLVN